MVAQSAGAPAARRNAEALVERMHELFRVTGAPGYMARFVGKLGEDFEAPVEFQQLAARPREIALRSLVDGRIGLQALRRALRRANTE